MKLNQAVVVEVQEAVLAEEVPGEEVPVVLDQVGSVGVARKRQIPTHPLHTPNNSGQIQEVQKQIMEQTVESQTGIDFIFTQYD